MAVTQLDEHDLARRSTEAVFGRFPGATVSDVRQIVGGTSSLTYLAEMTSPQGDRRRVVVKAAPPGLEPVRNRDVLRQARLFDVLVDFPGVRVPEVLGIGEGAPPEIPPLFVMSHVPGESYEPAFATDPPTVSVEQLRQRAFAAATMAAALHAVDVTDARIAGERVSDPAAEVERWARAFASVDEDLRSGHERVRDALLAQLPDALAPSVLHGDFRLGNMQCQGGRVEALIDWEIWSLGDRRLDLAWFLLNSDPKHPNSQRADTGLPEPAALIATYEEASGVPINGLGWFGALVRYKQAAASVLIIKNNRKLPQPGVDVDRMIEGRGHLLAAAMEQLA